MAAKESGVSYERVFVPYGGHTTGAAQQQRFVLDDALFLSIFSSKGLWRTTNVMRIPVIDENKPADGPIWIDARLFSDGYLRGNVKAKSGEVQTITVDVNDRLAGAH